MNLHWLAHRLLLLYFLEFTFFCVHRFDCVIPNISLITGIVVIFSIHVFGKIRMMNRLCEINQDCVLFLFCSYCCCCRRLLLNLIFSILNVLSEIEMMIKIKIIHISFCIVFSQNNYIFDDLFEKLNLICTNE